MTEYTKYRSHKTGLPPGTLTLPPGDVPEVTKISLIHWTEEKVEHITSIHTNEISSWIEKPGTTWIMVEGIRDLKALAEIGVILDLHPLMLEDISNPIQRPKLEDFQNKVFIFLELLHYIPEKIRIEEEQISLVMSEKFIITFTQGSSQLLKPLIDRLNNSNSRLRHNGPDYITYAFIDLIVDYTLSNIGIVNNVLSRIEEQMLSKPPKSANNLIHKSKKLVWDLRASLLPMNEVTSQFQRLEIPWIQKTTKFYMHDVHDHINQGLDLIASSRDTALSLLEIYRTYQNQKMNDIMKTLTIVSTIFVPLTFISSLYGMNFKYMPELNWEIGYPLAIGLMICIASGMLLYFRKNDWI